MTPPRLPADAEHLLAETLAAARNALSSSLAEIMDQIGRDAFAVGYERGWHEGWEAVERAATQEVTTPP